MKKKITPLILLSILSFSCKSEKIYKLQNLDNEESISLIIRNNKILCPTELCGKQTVTLNDSIIDENEEYYFLEPKNIVCYLNEKTKYIRSSDNEDLFYVKSFDEQLFILVSVVSGNTYEFIRYKDEN